MFVARQADGVIVATRAIRAFLAKREVRRGDRVSSVERVWSVVVEGGGSGLAEGWGRGSGGGRRR